MEIEDWAIEAEGKDIRVLMDTDENVKTMSRSQLIPFLDQNVDFDYTEGSIRRIRIKIGPCTSPVTMLGFRPKSWAKSEA